MPPQVLTLLDTFMLLFNASALYWAVTRFGAPGAAVVALVSRLLAGSLLSVAVVADLGAERGKAGE